MHTLSPSVYRHPQSIQRIPILVILMLCDLAPVSTALAVEEPRKTTMASNRSNAEVVTALRSAYGEWRRRLKAKGNYSMITGRVDRLADVADPRALRNPERYHGFLAVADGLLRLKHIPEQAPQISHGGFTPGKTGSVSFVKYLTTDEVYDGHIFLSFKPEQATFEPTAQLTGAASLEPGPDGMRRAPGAFAAVLNPIEPSVVHPGGMPGEPFPLPMAESFDVRAQSSGVTSLHVIVPRPAAHAQTGDAIEYTCDWEVSFTLPVIKRIEYAERDGTNRIRTQIEISLEQPCAINGVSVATHVRKVTLINA